MSGANTSRVASAAPSETGPLAERLLVTARLRQRGQLPQPWTTHDASDPTLTELTAALAAAGPERSIWLSGGEPTLRADLPAVIAAAAHERSGAVGIVSDGLALSRGSALEPLRRAGLSRVRLLLHSARPDAHDWLVGREGAARRQIRALTMLRSLGMRCEIDATVTRPTMTQLDELVALSAELGVRRLHLRRLQGRWATPADQLMLTPRLGLLLPYLERAAQLATFHGLELTLHDFPRCTSGTAARCRAAQAEPWRLPQGAHWAALAAALSAEETGARCPECPAAPACAGAPASYLTRFGRAEFLPSAEAPATRVSPVLARARGIGTAAEPALRRSQLGLATLRVHFGGPATVACPICGEHERALPAAEPTRQLRLRLVRAAQQGAARLRVASASSLDHPAAADMLRECCLLFQEVEVAAEASALGAMDDAALYGMRGLKRVDAALYGPDAARHDQHVGRAGAFAATLSGLERLQRISGVSTGAFAVLHNSVDVRDYASAWASGKLPGAPQFRLSPQGASLQQLAEIAVGLDGACRAALLKLLPPCVQQSAARARGLQRLADTSDAAVEPAARHAEQSAAGAGCAFHDALAPDEGPLGSDLHAIFSRCECGPELQQSCPGIAAGWRHDVTR